MKNYYNRPEMKREVKDKIRNCWGLIFVALLVFFVIEAGLGTITFGLAALLALPIMVGIYHICKDVLNDIKPDFNKLFMGYKDLNNAFNIILLSVLTTIFTFLWTLLFVIPGIIAFYRYSQALYILIENPEIGPFEAIKRSKEMMNGHKWEKFVFDLSFIGHYLLIIITCGIWSIYALPYIVTANLRYHYYLNSGVNKKEQIDIFD